MSTFKVDNEQVNSSVETLRKLLEECEEAYTKEIPESTVDKGQTHGELTELCENMKITCYYLGELINNTILFLGQSSEMFEMSDKDSAAAITAAVANSLWKSGTIATENTNSSSSKSGIKLEPSMGSYSMNQHDYNMMYNGYNAGCMATAYAIGQSIVTGEPQNPEHFWNDTTKQANCREAKVTGWISADITSIYDSLNNGKPTMLHFTHSSTGGQHWIVISGVSSNASASNLTYSDFTAIDPADGKTKNLQELLNSCKDSNVDGMKQFL